MKKIMMLLSLILFFAASIFTCLTQETPLEITILHNNDHHGHVEAFDIPGQKGVGGMPARMSLVKEVREEMEKKGGAVFLFDCGDINTGEPLSDMLTAEPDIKLMNQLGYQAMCVGNHEFDAPMEKMLVQKSWADFPFLSANVFYKKSGQLVFKPWVQFDFKGLKIGVLGITTHYTPYISTCGNNPELVFIDPKEVLPNLLKEMKEKVDFIIALMHMDHEDTVALIKNFQDIDLVLGGHTHLPLMEPVKVGKTLVAEAGYYGLMMGRFDFTFEKNKMTKWKYQLIGINLTQDIVDESGKVVCKPFTKKFEQDGKINDFLKPYQERTEKMLGEVIGTAVADVPRGLRTEKPKSSPLGNMIADSMREFAKADVAFQNLGGVRDDLLKGSITFRTVRRILPFSNTLVICKMTGKQILDLLTMMASHEPRSKGFLEGSGISLQIKKGRLLDVKIDGNPIVEGQIYKVAVNSFIASGGDGYSILKELKDKVDTGYYLSNIFADYIKKLSSISPDKTERVKWIE